MITFSNPYLLWGLGALFIPIIIHLWSKKIRKEIYLGTLEFINTTSTQSMKSVQLSDILLLVIRLLILVLLILLLAGIFIRKNTLKDSKAYFIDPYYLSRKEIKILKDSVDNKSLYVLADGLPLLSNYKPVLHNSTDYEVLFEELSKFPSNENYVFSPLRISDLKKASLPSLSDLHIIQLPEKGLEKEHLLRDKNGKQYKARGIYLDNQTTYNWNTSSISTISEYTTQDTIKYFTGTFYPEVMKKAMHALTEKSILSLVNSTYSKSEWLLFPDSLAMTSNQKILLPENSLPNPIWPVTDNLILVDTSFARNEISKVPNEWLAVLSQGYDSMAESLLQFPIEEWKNGKQKNVDDQTIQHSTYSLETEILIALLLLLLFERWITGRRIHAN